MLRKFDFYNYDEKSFPVAVQIERAVNSSKTEQLKEILPKNKLEKFMLGCLIYWAATERYDLRNRYAVLASKVIIEHFPKLKHKRITNEILKESYGFTCCAHRYLQNEFFKLILKSIEQNDTLGIYSWFESQQFVLSKNEEKLIPYNQYTACTVY